MFFGMREFVGWVLIVAALWFISIALGYVDNRQIVEAGVTGMIALGTLRAGVLLVRLSTAARIATAKPAKENELPQGGK